MALPLHVRRLIAAYLKRVNPRGYQEQDELVKLIRILES